MRIARLIGYKLIAVLLLIVPIPSRAQVAVGISVNFGPPALPVYEQPICPEEGYIWTPGYWAYNEYDGYYWVPGTWVQAPVGMLWTPGYWGYQEGAYVWYPGYWGPQVGFYGGIFYGYGYTGRGYEGGYWERGSFYYNRSVNNISNVHVTNVYNKTVVNNVTVNNVSYNGGPGGVSARATAAEEAAARAPHTPPTAVQVQHEHEAGANRAQFATVNHGKPGVAATARPAEFSGRGVVSAKAAAPYNPPPKSAAQPEKPNRPANAAPLSRPEPSNPREPEARPEKPVGPSGNVNPQAADAKRQQQMDKLQQKQSQERQQMAVRQQQETQRQQQKGANEKQQQAMQQKHQQQTQQLEQKHTQQMQKIQPKPAPEQKEEKKQ